MPELGSRADPGQAGPARIAAAALCPNWIRTFGDPELTALVEDAVVRNPDLKAAAARVEASRYAVRIAAASLYPRIAMKGSRQPTGKGDSVATSVAASIRRASAASRESTTAAAAPLDTSMDDHHAALGLWPRQSARHGKPMSGAAFARKKLPRQAESDALA